MVHITCFISTSLYSSQLVHKVHNVIHSNSGASLKVMGCLSVDSYIFMLHSNSLGTLFYIDDVGVSKENGKRISVKH